MLPVLGFTPFMFQTYSTTADHYLYLPMLGVAVAVAWGVSRWPGRGTAVAVGMVVGVLAARSVVQAGYWADEETLDRHTLVVNPQSSTAHTNLGAALQYRGIQLRSGGLLREAEQNYREAIRLDPTTIIARQDLAVLMIHQGRIDDAIRILLDAIAVADSVTPEQREALGPSHRALGAVLAKRGRLEEAAEQYRAALEYEPGSKVIEGELAEVERKIREKDEGGRMKDESGKGVGRPTSSTQR
jgi:tetratricopeptide (TPR) repeat protein